MESIDRLYPFRDAAPLMGMKPTKAYAEVAEGRLTIVRNGGRTFVRASEINRYINSLSADDTPSKKPKAA